MWITRNFVNHLLQLEKNISVNVEILVAISVLKVGIELLSLKYF